MAITSTIYVPESYLGNITGVAQYVYNPDDRSMTQQTGTVFGDASLLFYQVSIIDGQGAWWAPTAAESLRPLSWPLPFVMLAGEGDGIWTQVYGESVLRPENYYWWIPASVQANLPFFPTDNQGTVSGNFPLTAPTTT